MPNPLENNHRNNIKIVILKIWTVLEGVAYDYFNYDWEDEAYT